MTAAPLVLVTGASSGIGEATIRLLAGRGFETIAAARRLERCQDLAKEVGGTAIHLDVTDPASVDRMANSIERLDAIVHCAGGALDLDHLGGADLDVWREMYESNVLGLARVTQSLLDRLERSPAAHIIIVGSIAGVEVYPGGGGYTAAKHAVNAVARTLRLELLETGIRVTEVAPGLVETEFSLVRFGGDQERAKEVYRGLDPLTAKDVAEVIVFALERPAHVNIDYVAMKPVAQASAMITRRRPED
jgi:NADP-dependent 3-hydroxy acid dehydrogenase YdfG